MTFSSARNPFNFSNMAIRISFATRIITFVFFSVICLAATCIGLLYDHRVKSEFNAVIAAVKQQVDSDELLQIATFNNDAEILENILSDYYFTPAVMSVSALDKSGNPLIESKSADFKNIRIPPFGALRDGIESTEFSVSSQILASDKGRYLDIIKPIFIRVNPQSSLDFKLDYRDGLTQIKTAKSWNLTGYIRVEVSESLIKSELYPYFRGLIDKFLTALVLFFIVSVLFVVKITYPLKRIVRISGGVSEGNLRERFPVQGSTEFRQIGLKLNRVIDDLNNYRAKLSVDNKLLSLKVDESSVQLERRNQELSHAVKQLSKTENRLKYMAYYDSLTNLPNRQFFSEQLDLLLKLAKRHNSLLGLLFIDLDNFKRINDSLGHGAGDNLLCQVAERITSCIRESDLIGKVVTSSTEIDVSRLGGDEFTVVLNDLVSPEAAGYAAERILDALRKPILIDDHELVMTPSIGIAIAPRDADSVEDLLKRADTAMYQAKARGRNLYIFYSTSMQGTGVERLKMENELRKAIERDELVLFYQPQVSSLDGSIVGAEALVRWNHPERGLVFPDQFIPLAEEMGLIGELGTWTLNAACKQVRSLLDEGIAVPKISVNISSVQFSKLFALEVKKVLVETSIDPDLLEIEMTESTMMNNAEASIEALYNLKSLGVSISVDDFGTGYSSLNYLSRFPLDELKIDRSFVIELDDANSNSSLVSAIIAMGKSLNLRLVAEGVDTETQFGFLRARGVETIQGYLFSKPVPVVKFRELLANNPFHAQVATILQLQVSAERGAGSSRAIAH